MAVTYNGAGTTLTGSGSTSLFPNLPTRSNGDLLVVCAGNKAYSTTFTANNGLMTARGSVTSGTTASGGGTGSVRASAWTSPVTGSEGAGLTASTATTVHAAKVMCFSLGSGEEWDVEGYTGADTSAGSTTISITIPDMGLVTGDKFVMGLYIREDDDWVFGIPTITVSVPGCTLSSTAVDAATTSAGDDLGYVWRIYTVSSGSQSGTGSVTTSSVGSGESEAAATFTRIRAVTPSGPEGTASGDVTVTGSATGDEPPLEGTATGDVAITGSADGEHPPPGEGAATGDLEVTGSAVGDMPPDVKTGTASGTLDIEPEASGVRDSSGEADPGSVDVSGSAEGSMPKYGSATGSLDVDGSADGARVSKGIITPQNPNLSLFAGDVTGDAPGAGYVPAVAPPFASVNIVNPLTRGNKRHGKIIVGFDGNAVRIESFEVAGQQGTSYRSGSASGDLAVTGSATGTKPLYGDATGSLTITGSASGDVPDNTGSSTGTVTVTGSASGERDSLGSVTGALNVTSIASGEKTVSGSATGSVTITGSTGGDVPPNDGSTSGTVTITAGTVDGRRPHKGTATAGFDGIALKIWDPTVIGQQPVQTGDATGSVSITGAAQGTNKHGAASGSVAVTGTASGRVQREGAALGPANQAPALIVLLGEASGSAPEPGEGSASGSLSIAGDAVPGVRDPVGSVTESVTITGSATGNIDPNLGSSTGSYSLVGSASGKKVQKAVAVGSYSYSGTSTGTRTPKAAATGGYVFTGGGVSATYRAGQAAGTVNVAGVATGRRDLLADVTLVLDRGPYGNDLAARIQPRRTVAIDGPWSHALAPALQPRRALRVGHPQQKQISIRIRSTE